MVGSRVQQTCNACVAQAAEVVRNGKGGTGSRVWQPWTEGAQRSRGGRRRERQDQADSPELARSGQSGHRGPGSGSLLASSSTFTGAGVGGHLVRSRTVARWEWTRRAHVDGGAIFETTHERSPARLPVTHRLRRVPRDPGRDGGDLLRRALPATDARSTRSRRCQVLPAGALLRQATQAGEALEHRQPDHASGSPPPPSGSDDEAPAQRLLLREHGTSGHGIFGCRRQGSCAGGMARPPCSLRTPCRGRACVRAAPAFGPGRGAEGDDGVQVGSEGQEGSSPAGTLR